ncbi:MAG: hypothetical protein QXF76_02725 [Candidatus Anstonellales archaeon]
MGERIQKILNLYSNELLKMMKNNLIASMQMRASETGVVKSSSLDNFFTIVNEKGDVSIQMPFYAAFLEEGVKGAKKTYRESINSPFQFKDKMPPSKVFEKFKITKNKKSIFSKKGEKSLKNKTVKDNKQIAYAIAKSIRDNGIKGYHFVEKTFQSGLIEKMISEIADAYEKEIDSKIKG